MIGKGFILILLLELASAEMWEDKLFDNMPVDHFSFSAFNYTFSMRYLINTTSWTKGGPILFYAGNEGDVTMFAKNTGIMFDMAPEFNAMVLFAEHRYYGRSMPFGKESYSRENIGYLSSEQALADFAVFLRWMKGEIDWAFPSPYAANAKDSPVIVFGGSYGGMLAVWMRMKYPNVVIGAFASSAPIWQYHGITPCYVYTEIITRTFANSAAGCESVIRKSWNAITRLASTANGLIWLNENFKLCKNSSMETADDVQKLFEFLSDSYGFMAMVDYPYPNDFLRAIPGYPVKVLCERIVKHTLTNDKSIVSAIIDGIAVFQNYTGTVSCYQIGEVATESLGIAGWDYQMCTEQVMPICQNGKDMFYIKEWNFKNISETCYKNYGVRPSRDWIITNFWGTDLGGVSNIIFSNGLLDPWSGGGVLELPEKAGEELYVIIIQDGAHHYDLRGNDPRDTKEIRWVRAKEISIISRWLQKYYEKRLQKVLGFLH